MKEPRSAVLLAAVAALAVLVAGAMLAFTLAGGDPFAPLRGPGVALAFVLLLLVDILLGAPLLVARWRARRKGTPFPAIAPTPLGFALVGVKLAFVAAAVLLVPFVLVSIVTGWQVAAVVNALGGVLVAGMLAVLTADLVLNLRWLLRARLPEGTA